MLTLDKLSVSIEGKNILQDISFAFEKGKTYALMGPNGSGKSTLASALMGHPNVTIARTSKVQMKGKNIKTLSPDKRSHLGIFLSFQIPLTIPGVTVFELLRLSLEKKMDPVVLHKKILTYSKELHIKDELLKRSLNDGFSGGEKKKLEALQAVLLEPSFALFDEIDTGVDVDALKTISRFLKKYLPKETTSVYITHSSRLLTYIKPHKILVLKDGKLIKTGGPSLAKNIESKGFDSLT